MEEKADDSGNCARMTGNRKLSVSADENGDSRA
jgi:hypothetical protein